MAAPSRRSLGGGAVPGGLSAAPVRAPRGVRRQDIGQRFSQAERVVVNQPPVSRQTSSGSYSQ